MKHVYCSLQRHALLHYLCSATCLLLWKPAVSMLCGIVIACPCYKCFCIRWISENDVKWNQKISSAVIIFKWNSLPCFKINYVALSQTKFVSIFTTVNDTIIESNQCNACQANKITSIFFSNKGTEKTMTYLYCTGTTLLKRRSIF